MIPVPVLTPRLSSYWCSLVTPVPSSIARPLIEGLRNEVVVRDPVPSAAFGVAATPFELAVRRAIERVEGHDVETTWFDSLGVHGRTDLAAERSREGMIVDRHRRSVRAGAAVTFAEVERLGGAAGWPYANPLWRIRGLMDRAVGGPGMRLGRRDPDRVRVGDAVDFWRVEAVRRPELLRLRAEMKVPGRAWLQYEVSGDERQQPARADGLLRAPGPQRAALLVRAAAGPPAHLPRLHPRAREASGAAHGAEQEIPRMNGPAGSSGATRGT